MMYNDVVYNIDMEYSFKDFTGRELLALNLNNKIIYASCFSQEILDRQIFAQNTSNLILIKCNLNNCTLPAGVTTIDCSQTRFHVQEDGFDWEVDEQNLPVRRL